MYKVKSIISKKAKFGVVDWCGVIKCCLPKKKKKKDEKENKIRTETNTLKRSQQLSSSLCFQIFKY